MTCFVASYDVTSDSQRRRVSKILTQYGNRIQKSVFLVWLDLADVSELKRRVGPLLARSDEFDLIPVDLHPDRKWLRWQRPIECVQDVILI